MAKFVNYKRIVVFQRRSGWVCDLGPGKCKAPLYDMGESYFNTGAGTRKAIARTRSLIIPVFDEVSIDHLRIMHREQCEIRCIAIGDAVSIVWEMDSAMNLVEANEGIGGFATNNLVFNNDVKWGSIYQSNDLLAGIPWECQTATLIDGVYYLSGPSGYTGNRFIGASGDSVDEDGAATIGGSNVYMDMYFPLEGCNLTFSGTWTGNVKARDFSGSDLTTYSKNVAGTDLTITGLDAGTWTLRIEVNSASAKPTMHVTSAGSLNSPRTGGCIDCTDLTAELSTAPDWSS